jgi:hypothetical protein
MVRGYAKARPSQSRTIQCPPCVNYRRPKTPSSRSKPSPRVRIPTKNGSIAFGEERALLLFGLSAVSDGGDPMSVSHQVIKQLLERHAYRAPPVLVPGGFEASDLKSAGAYSFLGGGGYRRAQSCSYHWSISLTPAISPRNLTV